jgi:hypothetical protein
VAKTYQCGLPKPDMNGRYRPVVGVDHRGRPQRFQVGTVAKTTPTEAQRRLSAIRDLYARQCTELGLPHWANWTQEWANQLARQCPILYQGSDYSTVNDGQAAEELSVIHRLQGWGVPIQIVNPQFLQSGLSFIEKLVDQKLHAALKEINSWGKDIGKDVLDAHRGEVLPASLDQIEQTTLHQAIDAYSIHLTKTGKRDDKGRLVSYVRKCQERLNWLKSAHGNLPLWKVRLSEIEGMVAFWRNRPATKKSAHCSAVHSAGMIQELFRFFRWLDTSSFRWNLPAGAQSIKRKPVELPEDNQTTAFSTIHKPTYTPEQLATICRHANPLGRAIIAVCVNCGFGASEIGQISTEHFVLRKKHPYAETIGFFSTEKDSWITSARPKTSCYGEHLLWEKVAQAVEPFLDGREVLPINKDGSTWYKPHSTNAQQCFCNWWVRLLDKVIADNPDFPRLPFGSLRDTLPDVLRAKYSEEEASICLQHGSREDDLLKCYANVPFHKLFAATRGLETYFKPLLNVLQ